METWPILFLLAVFVSVSSAGECEDRYSGARCVSMFPNECQAGNYYTYNFCGFLEQCCIPQNSVHTTPASSGTTSSPSTSSCEYIPLLTRRHHRPSPHVSIF
ncbi:hypothetical protein ScPMuIL_003016 [Solemya velum]